MRTTLLLLLTVCVSASVGEAQNLDRVTAGLQWRELGPTIMSGRVADLAVVESNPSTFYVGTASGGVWKTVNGGTTFTPVFTDQPTASIGDVTLAPSNPNIVWVGSGEPQNRQSSPWGNGVYRSLDAGRTWTHMGLERTHHVSRIEIHPTNPDVIYVAAMGHLWGTNPERGVFKSIDGGKNWTKVLFVDDRTGAIDLAMDPNDPNTLFAAMYQRQRTGYGFNGGGPGSAIYRSFDGGATWTKLTKGLPGADKGRIGLAIYPKNSNLVYAQVEARPGQGVYRSMDRGETWEFMSDNNNRPMYYSQIRIDPTDPERIYTGGSRLHRSSDGGKTLTDDAARDVHLDHHALWIDPANSNHMILAGDGGVSITWDRGENWRQLENLPVSQFYEIGFDYQWPYHVCGGLQDNGSWCAPSNTLSNQGIRTKDWYNIGGGDGFYTVLDPEDATFVFGESQGGNVYLLNRTTWESMRLRPIERSTEDNAPRYRWNWDTPVVMSQFDRATIYVGSNHVHRSRDRGWTWEVISPDLTRQIDRDTLEIMGQKLNRPLMSRNDGISSYGNLTALSESPLDANVLWAGTDDGLVHITRNGGSTWTNLTERIRGLPARTYVTRLIASRHVAGRVYATFDGHYNNDYAPYAYVSDDFGQTWRAIASGLPNGWSVNAFAEHPRNPNLLFLGNEVGIYTSIDRGAQWTRMKNVPTVPVDDIQIHPRENDLIIGTHGRGIWILDDITPLEELTVPAMMAAAHLFSVQPAISYNEYTPQGWTPSVWVADNPEQGARIRYHLASDLPAGDAVAGGASGVRGGANGAAANTEAGKVRLTITGEDGQVIRTLEGPGTAGLHEVLWDFRYEAPYEPEAQEGGFGFFGAPRGPKVLPGTYMVRLEAGAVSQQKPVTVNLDPRVQIFREDLIARQDALMSAYALAKPSYEAGQAARRLMEQLGDIQEMLTSDVPKEVSDEVRNIRTELGRIQGEIGRASSGARGSFSIERSTTRPTADQLWQLERSWEELPPAIEKLNAIITQRMPALNRMLNQHGVRPAVGTRIELPRKP